MTPTVSPIVTSRNVPEITPRTNRTWVGLQRKAEVAYEYSTVLYGTVSSTGGYWRCVLLVQVPYEY